MQHNSCQVLFIAAYVLHAPFMSFLPSFLMQLRLCRISTLHSCTLWCTVEFSPHNCPYCCRWCPKCHSPPRSHRPPSTGRIPSWSWWSSDRKNSWPPSGRQSRCHTRCLRWQSSSMAGQRWGYRAYSGNSSWNKGCELINCCFIKEYCFIPFLVLHSVLPGLHFLSKSIIFFLCPWQFCPPSCLSPFPSWDGFLLGLLLPLSHTLNLPYLFISSPSLVLSSFALLLLSLDSPACLSPIAAGDSDARWQNRGPRGRSLCLQMWAGLPPGRCWPLSSSDSKQNSCIWRCSQTVSCYHQAQTPRGIYRQWTQEQMSCCSSPRFHSLFLTFSLSRKTQSTSFVSQIYVLDSLLVKLQISHHHAYITFTWVAFWRAQTSTIMP